MQPSFDALRPIGGPRGPSAEPCLARQVFVERDSYAVTLEDLEGDAALEAFPVAQAVRCAERERPRASRLGS